MTRKMLPSQDADLWPGQPQLCRAGLGCGASWMLSAGLLVQVPEGPSSQSGCPHVRRCLHPLQGLSI